MDKELTHSQVISRFVQLQGEANCLDIRVENKNGFDIFCNESLINHYNTLDEVEIYLSGYKAAQMQAACEKEGL